MRKTLQALALTAVAATSLLTSHSAIAAPVAAKAAASPYVPGTLRPSADQATQDAALMKYWNFWKTNFLSTKCGSGTYAVLSKDADHAYVAEGEGYGMTIAAMMGAKDPQARAIFDGILKFVKAHPSVNNKDLHAAEQDANCKSVNGSDSATDGDLEIAYGLLVADKVWGSSGSVNYLAEAKRVINAIKASEVNSSSKFMLLGDWGNDAEYKNSSRSSDWMPGHFRAFAKATGDSTWTSVRTTHENAITKLQSQFSSTTGLLPDFVVNTNSSSIKPAPANFLEGSYDGAYSWNACRDPWRLGADAITASDSAAKAQVRKMNTWIQSKTGGDPAKIGSGYKLNGTATESGEHPCFTAPFAVAAMTDPGSQAWLDKLFAQINKFSPDKNDYYGTGITLQVLIILSGNFVAP
ncbi:glycosyl hydrolase family 8 [Lentzea sp. NPDC058450]|uniref:glycosyl hydrolase family 8 n=1 Tax=Lentzea sp. NPDC058450 TaxID=3346505 RepID=UPI003649B35B